MKDGGAEMQDLLQNDTDVLAAVDIYMGVAPNIFNMSLLPDNIDLKKKTINHMRISNISGGNLIGDFERQVSCRAYTEALALVIQSAAFTALNRKKSLDGSTFFVAAMLPIIVPQNSSDNYNAPLSVRTIATK